MASYQSEKVKAGFNPAIIDCDKQQAVKEPAAVIDLKNNKIIIC